jgi:hypothetical protein
MAQATITDFAEELARDIGWTVDRTWDGAETAMLRDIMLSLRAILKILACQNVQRMALAAQSIERILKEQVAKKKKRKRRTPARTDSR